MNTTGVRPGRALDTIGARSGHIGAGPGHTLNTIGARPGRALTAVLAGFILLCCAVFPAQAPAEQTVSLHATLMPERLGGPTTIGLELHIVGPAGHVPSPPTQVELSYPNNLGIGLSGLGLATCTEEIIEALGPEACPADSRMGRGTALAELPVKPEIIRETAPITLLRAPTQDGHFALLVSVNPELPVLAQVTLSALLLPARAPYGGRLDISVPLIPNLPESPNPALVELSMTIGPLGLTYYDHRGDNWIPYHPRGILLPDTCPRGGFPFEASLTFQDGSQVTTGTAVPCPPKTHRKTYRNR